MQSEYRPSPESGAIAKATLPAGEVKRKKSEKDLIAWPMRRRGKSLEFSQPKVLATAACEQIDELAPRRRGQIVWGSLTLSTLSKTFSRQYH